MQVDNPKTLGTITFYGKRNMTTRRRRNATAPSENGGKIARQTDESRKPKLEESESDEAEERKPAVSAGSFEEMRQKNIAERMAFLQSLNIEGIKLDLMKASNALTKKNDSKPRRRLKMVPKESLPRRQSLRLQSKDPEGNSLPERLLNDTWSQPSVVLKAERVGPIKFRTVLNGSNREDDEGSADSFLLEKSTVHALKTIQKESMWTKAGLKRLIIDDTCVEKVVVQRITSLVVHPSKTVTLACAGDKQGFLGFFKLAGDGGENLVETYSPHASAVMCLKVNAATPHHIYSSSYDDTIRRADIETGVFDEVYRSSEGAGVLYFAWDGPATMTLSHTDGCVSFVDVRAPSVRRTFEAHSRRIRTVDVHPVETDYFVTASTDSTVKIWDRRNVSKRSPKPVTTLERRRSCSSAFFSPVTGGKVVMTSLDNTIRVYDTSNMTGNIRMVTSIRHNNETGRWLTPFRAIWLPNHDDTFLVGSLLRPRRIEAYSSDGSLLHNLEGESLSSVCSVLDAHPTRPVLAGGNSSGRVHFFLEP